MERRLLLPVLVVALATLGGCALSSEPPPVAPVLESDAAHSPETADAATEDPSPAASSRLPQSASVDATLFIPGGPIDAGPEFVTPSGNTTCAIPGAGSTAGFRVVCSAAEHSWSYSACDPEAPICPRFTIIDDAGVTDEGMNGGAVTSYEAGSPVKTLAYGYSISYGGVTCASTTDFLICEDQTTWHGFLISRSEHTWF